jgi:hypothetical protein
VLAGCWQPTHAHYVPLFKLANVMPKQPWPKGVKRIEIFFLDDQMWKILCFG